MRHYIRENRILLLGILLPLFLVFLFEIAYFLPRWLVKPPQYDLLYLASPYPHSGASFNVVDGKLSVSINPQIRKGELPMPRLFLFEAKTQTSKEIPIELPAVNKNSTPYQKESLSIPALENLNISSNETAPDGYKAELSSPSFGGAIGLLLSHSYKRNFVISKNGNIIQLSEEANSLKGYQSIKFLGWVVPK